MLTDLLSQSIADVRRLSITTGPISHRVNVVGEGGCGTSDTGILFPRLHSLVETFVQVFFRLVISGDHLNVVDLLFAEIFD